MGFSMVRYLPDGQFVKTKDFTEGRCNYEPVEALVGEKEAYAFNYDRLTALRPSLGREYLDILYMDALCFNMGRHTKNYGALRNQSTGEVLRMAPNFDNSIALISRGYGQAPAQTNGLLIDLFVELLTGKNLPQDHLVQKIEAAIDWSFVYDLVDDKYSEDIGRPSLDPVTLIKLPILKQLRGGTIRKLSANIFSYFSGHSEQTHGGQASHSMEMKCGIAHSMPYRIIQNIKNILMKPLLKRCFLTFSLGV